MTREEAKIFLYSIAGDLGFRDMENYTCMDGEKMREAINTLDKSETVTEFADRCRECGSRLVNDILGKIRAEIEQEYNRLSATRVDETLELGECLGLKMSLKIIDKYGTESEE